jgi:hypothetical protein
METKMRTMILRYAVLIFAFGCSSVLTGETVAGEADGGYAGAFFQVPSGARPTAMGGAYRAVSDDGAAPLFNPAGLAGLKRPLFGSSYRAMKLDRTLGYVTLAFPVQGNSAMGVHWLYAGSGSVAARDTDGDLIGLDFSQNNHQFGIVFAKRFERVFAVGINLNYLYSKLPEISAASVGFDVGAMFYINELFNREKRADFPIKDIQIGLTVRHISKKYKWNSEKWELKYSTSSVGVLQDDDVPVEIGLGAAARFLDRKLLVATDVLKNLEQDPDLHAGAEYYLSEQLALRSGFSAGRLTAGTGYMFRFGKQVLLIDYAFSTDKADEGSEHIFSIDLQF